MLETADLVRFFALAARVLPWLAGATMVAFAAALTAAGRAPDDFQQGATV